jgi:hypothetical protein
MDHILLETTGLADPAPLVSVLWLDDQLESSIRLDSIITVSSAMSYFFVFLCLISCRSPFCELENFLSLWSTVNTRFV